MADTLFGVLFIIISIFNNERFSYIFLQLICSVGFPTTKDFTHFGILWDTLDIEGLPQLQKAFLHLENTVVLSHTLLYKTCLTQSSHQWLVHDKRKSLKPIVIHHNVVKVHPVKLWKVQCTRHMYNIKSIFRAIMYCAVPVYCNCVCLTMLLTALLSHNI